MRAVPARPIPAALLAAALAGVARPVHAQGDGRAAATAPPACDAPANWNTPQRPFRLYGNTYYVGTRCLSAVLVTSPAGHVLIDAGLPASAPLVLANVRALGFRTADVKLLLNSHAHVDHAGGIAAVQRATGARVAARAPSARVLRAGASGPDDPQYGGLSAFPPVRAVRVVAGGETLRLGPLALTAHATAGHTPGGTTWTWVACEQASDTGASGARGPGARRCFNVVYADSQTPVAARGFSFARSRTYPGVLDDFARGQAVLEGLRCDVLLTPHPEASGLWARVDARRDTTEAGPADALVDPDACRRYAAAARERVTRRVAEEPAVR